MLVPSGGPKPVASAVSWWKTRTIEYPTVYSLAIDQGPEPNDAKQRVIKGFMVFTLAQTMWFLLGKHLVFECFCEWFNIHRQAEGSPEVHSTRRSPTGFYRGHTVSVKAVSQRR